MKGRIDIDLDSVAFRIVEVERPGISVRDRVDPFDAGFEQGRAKSAKVVEAPRAKLYSNFPFKVYAERSF